ncbi:hypothetical protein J2Y69_003440 [Microbacterium resistens]|uniref:DUF3592 domain-containing protein n=1 Tax=Microbacterium resistens TaxID=156977 RepID=A0ABU1SGS6_9MICO|nr:hypothetical protein [Microbacterium resistens]MDR6868816.1 hypothetical protein [Microbacterium resistens]
MLKAIGMVVWLALSAVLLIWVGEGLFGVDQRQSLLSWTGDTLIVPILAGTFWGLLLTFGSLAGPRRRLRVRSGRTRVGVGTIVEVGATGLTVNDVPQYDIFIRVSPDTGGDFVGQLRTLVPPQEQGMLGAGLPLPVRFDPENHGSVAMADPREPEVATALLDWRIAKGLIDPTQVRARTTGEQVPAAVLAVRPTGRRREGQSELALRVLLTPDGRESWEADTTVFVYPQAIGRLQVGSPIWAFYRREDPRTVAITIEKEAGR